MKAIGPKLKAAGNDQQIAVLKVWKGTTKITFQRFPDGLDELTTIRGVATTPSTFVKPPVHFDPQPHWNQKLKIKKNEGNWQKQKKRKRTKWCEKGQKQKQKGEKPRCRKESSKNAQWFWK